MEEVLEDLSQKSFVIILSDIIGLEKFVLSFSQS